MNILTKNQVFVSAAGQHSVFYVSIRDREWCYNSDIFGAFEGFTSNGASQKYADDMPKFLEFVGLPADLTKFYKGFKHNIINSRSYNPGTRVRNLVVTNEIEDLQIDKKQADALVEAIRTKTPSAFAEISKKTAEKFVKIANDERGYDLSSLHFFATSFRLMNEGLRWGQYVSPETYIVTDNLLNPIDVKDMLDVIDKICVAE